MIEDIKFLIQIVAYSLPVFSAFFCIILLFFSLLNKKRELFTRKLMLLLICFYIFMIIYAVTIAFYFFKRTLFTYTASINFYCMLIIPVIIYHFIFKLTRLKKEEVFNLLHYAFPTVILLIYSFWMLTIPLDYRILLTDENMHDYTRYKWFTYFFNHRFYIRIIFTLYYVYLAIKRTVMYRKKIIDYSADLDLSSLNWLYRIFLCLLILFPAPIIYYYSHKDSLLEYIVLVLSLSFILVFNVIICYNIFSENFLLLTEDVLLNDKEYETDQVKSVIDPQVFEEYIETEKPYLRHDLKITDLIIPLNTNRTYLSRFINSYYKKNFSLYINNCRLEEFDRIKSDVNYNDFEDEELIYSVGFKSVSSYYRTREMIKKIKK